MKYIYSVINVKGVDALMAQLNGPACTEDNKTQVFSVLQGVYGRFNIIYRTPEDTKSKEEKQYCLECQNNPSYFAQYQYGEGPKRCQSCGGAE